MISRLPGKNCALLLCLCLLLCGCQGSPRQVSGEAPLIALDTIELQESFATLHISVRNLNDRRFEMEEIRLSLQLDQQQAASLDPAPVFLSVPARGREVIMLETELEPGSRQLLEALTHRQRPNLAWQLELVFDPPRGRLRAEANGFLHPVPGQPDRFR